MSQTKAQLIDNLVQALNFTSTASAPANGLFLSAANTLALATNSGQRLTIDSSGKVGIGTTSPAGVLEIDATSTTDMILLDVGGTNFAKLGHNSSGGSPLLDVRSEGHFRILTNGNNERFRISSGGDVGIGTSSPATSLEIVSTDAIIRLSDTNTSAVANDLIGELQFYSNDADGAHIAGYVKAIQDPSDAYGRRTALLLGTQTTGAQANEKVRIDHLGNVGIGTTSPSEKLEVNGTIKITGTGGQGVNIENSGGTNAACINLKNTLTNYVKEYRLAVAGSDGAYATASSLFIRDQTAGATRLELSTSGDFKVSSGDIFFGTAGKGIVLGATSNLDANTLEDYEEGTWTPTIEGSSNKSISTNYSATYVKIGRLVHCQCYLVLTGTGNSSVFLLGTLPFANKSNGYSTNVTDFGKGGRKGAYARVNTGATYAEFLYSSEDPANDRVTIKGQDVGNGYLITTIQYMTDS